MFGKEFELKIVDKGEYENYERVNGKAGYDNTEDDVFFNAATGMFSDADIIE